jgi:hypothetical protein
MSAQHRKTSGTGPTAIALERLRDEFVDDLCALVQRHVRDVLLRAFLNSAPDAAAVPRRRTKTPVSRHAAEPEVPTVVVGVEAPASSALPPTASSGDAFAAAVAAGLPVATRHESGVLPCVPSLTRAAVEPPDDWLRRGSTETDGAQALPPMEEGQAGEVVVRALATLGRATVDEVAERCALSHSTAQARLHALVEAGVVARRGSARGIEYVILVAVTDAAS